MRFEISKRGRRVGELETDRLSLATQDAMLRRLFYRARKNGIDVRGAAVELNPLSLISTFEHKPFTAEHPDAVCEWLHELRALGYQVEFEE